MRANPTDRASPDNPHCLAGVPCPLPRRIGLSQTRLENASCGTIRLKLMKIGALIAISVRRIKVAMASGCPAADVWGVAARRLNGAARARGSPA